MLAKLRSINPPCVPFAGTYLTQIVFFETGKSTFVQPHQDLLTINDQDTESVECDSLINFSKLDRRHVSFVKCRRIAAVIREIQMYQNQPYNLRVEPSIRRRAIPSSPLTPTTPKCFVESTKHSLAIQCESEEFSIKRNQLSKLMTDRHDNDEQFLESLNPLDGFKDKDDLETHLYNQSLKIEPKSGEMPATSPKHPPEALKSPGTKLAHKNSGTGRRVLGRLNQPTSSPRFCSSSAADGGLLSPTHANIPSKSPQSSSSVSYSAEEVSNFSFSPGQFPHTMGDLEGKSGRDNQAFASEYAPTSPMMTSILAQYIRHQGSNDSSPQSPLPISSIFPQVTINDSGYSRKRPPMPLTSNESHFTFPPVSQKIGPFGKPPAPTPPAGTDLEAIQQISSLPPSCFPLSKPPLPKKTISGQRIPEQKAPPRPPKKQPFENTTPEKPEATAPPRPPKKRTISNKLPAPPPQMP